MNVSERNGILVVEIPEGSKITFYKKGEKIADCFIEIDDDSYIIAKKDLPKYLGKEK